MSTLPGFHHSALVIGAGWSGQTLAQAFNKKSGNSKNSYRRNNYHLLGFIDDDPDKQGQIIAGIPVLGTSHDLVRLVQELRPGELVVAITHDHLIHEKLSQAILDCRELGIPIVRMTDLYERITGRVAVEHAGQKLPVVIPLSPSASYRLYVVTRRLFDIFVALWGCLLLAGIVPFVWFANRFTAPGEVLYRQTRVGKNGGLFHIVKFRSMVMDAEEHTGAVWASKDDERVTPVGRILRKTRLDEVPQFWNVLKGDMSLIGPRPERPEFVTQLSEKLPYYRVRHAVKPGITGWAQVEYSYGSSVKDALIKLQYDLYYIKHQGPFLDLMILIKTIQVVLGLQGR